VLTTPEHGGAGGPQSLEATRPIAREACHPSLAFYTDTFDRDFTLFFWAVVDGLEIDLALSTNASALWRCAAYRKGLVTREPVLASRTACRGWHSEQKRPEDTFLTREAWRVRHRDCVRKLAHTRRRGPGGQQNST
jgi:hypothetical protein